MMGVSDWMEITHQEPKLSVKVPFKMGENEQVLQFEHSTDNKKNQNMLPGGAVVTAKTQWKKERLVTKSESKGPMGSMKITEERTLSEDGKTMTVKLRMEGGPMDWTRTLVYDKVVN